LLSAEPIAPHCSIRQRLVLYARFIRALRFFMRRFDLPPRIDLDFQRAAAL
jgi:hypothetical protein